MKERVITALIMLAVIIGILFFVPILFTPFVAIILGIATWEWCKISKIHRPKSYLVAAITVLLWVLSAIYSQLLTVLMILSALHYLYAIRYIRQYEKIDNFRISKTYLMVAGPITLSALATTLLYIFHQSEDIPTTDDAMTLLFIILIIAAADTGAYFAGKLLGKHKLSPKVSPNKTIEGLAGGLLSAVVVALAFSFMIEGWYLSTGQLIFITLVTAVFSVIGDLFISIIKRQNHVKDSSQILPGHGGILDRIDGMLAGIPVFYLLQQFI